ncbi:MAG: diguanylate cyclase [Acidimicrobiales bacterium]
MAERRHLDRRAPEPAPTPHLKPVILAPLLAAVALVVTACVMAFLASTAGSGSTTHAGSSAGTPGRSLVLVAGILVAVAALLVLSVAHLARSRGVIQLRVADGVAEGMRTPPDPLLDRLTRLPNRRGFTVAASRVLGLPTAIVRLDLDGFGPVNAAFGSSVGDALLCSVAGVLRDAVRELPNHDLNPAVIARLGGDEFAMAIPGLSPHDVDRLLVGIVDRLGTTEIDGGTVVLGASVGVTFVDGTPRSDSAAADAAADAPRIESMLEESGLALRRAKRIGRGRVVHVDGATRAALDRWRDGTIDDVVEVGVRLQRSLTDRAIIGASVVAQVAVEGEEPLVGADLEQVASAWGQRFAVLDATLEGIAASSRPIPPPGLRLWFSVPAADVALPGGADALWGRLATVGLSGSPVGVELVGIGDEDPVAIAAAVDVLHARGAHVAVAATGPGAAPLHEIAKLDVERLLVDAATVDASHHGDPAMTAAIRAVVELGAARSIEVLALGVGSLDAGQRLTELGVGGAEVVVTEPWAAPVASR